jgi:hypothetical protein
MSDVLERTRRGFQKELLHDETIAAGATRRLFPGIDVSMWDRLHFLIAADARTIAGLSCRILFGTPMAGTHCGYLLADSTVWYEDDVSEREFSWDVPAGYNGTGLAMSVPVIAPYLYDVILENKGSTDLQSIYVTVMAQEI